MVDELNVEVDNSEDKSKMVIVMRKDLKMPKGKLVSQGAHAAVAAILQSIFNIRLSESNFSSCVEGFEIKMPAIVDDATKDWLSGEFTKICLAVNSEEELNNIYNEALKAGLNCSLIVDNGHTVFNGVKTKTGLAIGPAYSSMIDPITKNLPLY